MSNITTTDLCINGSIDLFINHWKFWKNFEDSTVLVDPSYNIIAFYDNDTDNIDVIQADLNFDGWYIITNWIPHIVEWKIKYIPYDYEMAMKIYSEQIWNTRKLENKDVLKTLYSEIKEEVAEYNREYFDNLNLYHKKNEIKWCQLLCYDSEDW